MTKSIPPLKREKTLAWRTNYTATAKSQLKKHDKQTARRIVGYMEERISPRGIPLSIGKVLTGQLIGFWCYRVGNYRIICDIQNDTLCVLVVEIGHRREVYR